MAYLLKVELHPLGVVVENPEGVRELLIEGEACCHLGYADLRQIAATSGKVELDEADAERCRLR